MVFLECYSSDSKIAKITIFWSAYDMQKNSILSYNISRPTFWFKKLSEWSIIFQKIEWMVFLKNEKRLNSEFILGKIQATHDVDAYFKIGHLKAFLDYILHFFELTNSDSSTFCYTQERRVFFFYQNPLSRSLSTPKNVC